MSAYEPNQSNAAVAEPDDAEPIGGPPDMRDGRTSELSSPPRIALNALYNMLSHVWLIGLAIFCTPYIVHRLGDGAYGLLSMVMAVSGYFAMLDLGFSHAVLKYASEYYGSGDYRRLSRLIGTGTTIYTGIGLVGGATIALLTGVIVTRVLHVEESLLSVSYVAFYLAAVGFLISMPLSVFNVIPTALQRMDITNQRDALIGTANTVGSVLLLSMGFWLREVIVLNVVTSALRVAVFVVVSKKLLPDVSLAPCFDRAEASRLLRYAAPTAASSTSSRIISRLDRLFVGMFWPMAHVTYYVIPAEICQRGVAVVSHVTRAMFPAISHLSSSERREAVQAMYRQSMRLLAYAVMPLFVLLVVLARPLLTAWMGERIATHSARVLALVAAGTWFQSLAAVQHTFLMAMGRAGLAAKWIMVPAGASLVLNLVLIPRFGADGAALTFLIVTAGTAVPYVWFVCRRILDLPLGDIARHHIAAAVLSAVCVLPTQLAGGSLGNLGLGPLALVVVLLYALYAAAAVASRVVPRSDVAFACEMLRHLRRGRAEVPR